MGLSSPTTPFGAHLPPADAFLLPLFTEVRGRGFLRSSHQASEAGNMIVVESGDPPGKWVWREKTSCP
jgi:hypothetical protein